MKKSLVLLVALTMGCAAVNPVTVATGLAVLHNALAVAQVGYQDYAMISNKSTDPKTQAAMQTIDGQLNVLGALAYNTVQPTQADIAKAQSALQDVASAKATIATQAAMGK